MGFLDFLKKDKPQSAVLPPPSPMPKPPLDMPLPADPGQIDWASPPRMDERVPLPPVAMQNHDIFDQEPDIPTAEPELPGPEAKSEPLAETKAEPLPEPDWTQHTDLPDPAKIELPDFTDDDIAAIPEPKWQPPQWTPKAKIVTEEPIAEGANAVAIPADEIRLPTGEMLEFDKIEPAKFLSSTAYFETIADIKAMRKSLRQNDDVIKEAALQHEHLDYHFKRVASDINAVQEHFMKIDASLFEEG